MTNVESAAVAGGEYNLRAILGADGVGAIAGAVLGCPFPPAVYIGHPGWKAAGGRTSYSLASGVVIALMCFLGRSGCAVEGRQSQTWVRFDAGWRIVAAHVSEMPVG